MDKINTDESLLDMSKELDVPQAAQAQYVWVRASEVILSNLVGIY